MNAIPTEKLVRGFSLVELLVVIAILAVVSVISAAAYRGVTESSALNSAGSQLTGQLYLARQNAISQNRIVEMRFYKLADRNDAARTAYLAMQPFVITASTTNALGKPVYLPSRVQISDDPGLSNLMNSPDALVGTGSSANFTLSGAGNNYSYIGFRYKPDGSTTLKSRTFLTLHSANDPGTGAKPPRNWFSVQIDPVTGTLQSFRP